VKIWTYATQIDDGGKVIDAIRVDNNGAWNSKGWVCMLSGGVVWGKVVAQELSIWDARVEEKTLDLRKREGVVGI